MKVYENDTYDVMALSGKFSKKVPMKYLRSANVLCSGKNVGKRTAKTLLKGNLFRVPTFQRRYAWNDFDWNGLWEDLGKPGHSMGNICVYEEEGRLIVVDGQ